MLTLFLLPAPAADGETKISIGPGAWSVQGNDGRIYLEIAPPSGTTAAAKAQEYLAPGQPTTPYRGKAVVRLPFSRLSEKHQLPVFISLYPNDYLDASTGRWVHYVSYEGEALWSIAEWLTGRGANYKAIVRENRLRSETIRKGQRLFIPKNLILPVFRKAQANNIFVGSTDRSGQLKYQSDQEGMYALYTLKRGETLYKSVVGRFTGRTIATDVNDAVKILVARNRIRDAKRLQPGTGIKIPIRLLSPEYRPPNDPERVQMETDQRRIWNLPPITPKRSLRGIMVVLDPGHGGIDPGATAGTIHEDEYTYDLMCRIRELLISEGAEVVSTVWDSRQGFKPNNSRSIRPDRNEYINVSPRRIKMDNKRVSLPLRFYKANAVYDEFMRNGGNKDNIVFTSLHIDSLHFSMYGAMVYYPRPSLSRGSYVFRDATLASRINEVGNSRRIPESSHSSRTYAMSRSKKLADQVIDSIKHYKGGQNRPAVDPDKPSRDYFVRRGKFVMLPILKHNKIPTKILLEVLNLQNKHDRERLLDPKFRQWVAEAYVDALKKFYEI